MEVDINGIWIWMESRLGWRLAVAVAAGVAAGVAVAAVVTGAKHSH